MNKYVYVQLYNVSMLNMSEQITHEAYAHNNIGLSHFHKLGR